VQTQFIAFLLKINTFNHIKYLDYEKLLFSNPIILTNVSQCRLTKIKDILNLNIFSIILIFFHHL
jgi:hypothetical protein